MKKNYFLLILSLFVSGLAGAQGIYHIQSSSLGTTYVLSKDSVLINAGMGVYNYKMALFNPNTKDWSYLSKDYTPFYYTKIIMKDKNEGIGLGYDFKVYKTTDCWKTVKLIAGAPPLVQVGSTPAGYYGKESVYGGKGTLHFSTDGETWTKVLELSNMPTVSNYGNKVVALINYQEKYVSYDGGKTYKNININSSVYDYPELATMLDTNTIIAYHTTKGTNNLYISADGGKKWIGRYIAGLATVSFKNAAEGFIIDYQGLKFTSDTGKTWTKPIVLPANAGGLFRVGDILMNVNTMTKDKGLTWEPALPRLASQTYNDVDFKGNLGIMGSGAGIYAISTDGGKTLVPSATKIGSQNITAVKVFNDSVIYAGDQNGQIFISSNKGKSWTQKYSNSFGYFAKKISISTDGNIIAMTRNAQPLVSGDKGATFDYFSVGGGSHSQTVKPNGEILDISGHNNGGSDVSIDVSKLDVSNPSKWTMTLIKEIPIAGLNIIDIVMKDDNVGYILAQNKTTYATVIIQTTDGWKNYAQKGSIPGSSGENYLKNWPSTFIFGDTLVVSGKGLKYYHYSFNQGTTWALDTLNYYLAKQSSAPTTEGAHFFSAKKYFLTVSGGGAFLNSKGNLVSTGIVSVPKAELSQFIYPNPVASSGFYISQITNDRAIVKIYDLLGSLVKSTVSEDGFVDIAELKGGLYFVELYQNNKRFFSGKVIKE